MPAVDHLHRVNAVMPDAILQSIVLCNVFVRIV